MWIPDMKFHLLYITIRNILSPNLSLIPTPQRISALGEIPVVILSNICSSDIISGCSVEVWMRMRTWSKVSLCLGSHLFISWAMLSFLA